MVELYNSQLKLLVGGFILVINVEDDWIQYFENDFGDLNGSGRDGLEHCIVLELHSLEELELLAADKENGEERSDDD